MKVYAFFVAFTFWGFSLTAQNRIYSDDQIPILAWIGVPEEETDLERFTELKESGINVNFSSYTSVIAVEKALDIAQRTGVKLLPYCPELKSDPEKTVKRLMKHPALFGYHLRDEPNAADFSDLAAWVKRIQSVDKQHSCYINLFPNYASAEQLFSKEYIPKPEKDIYTAHIETFLKEVPVPFLSFDHYPIIEKEGKFTLRPEWYKNLEIVAKATRENGIPFWAFALSVAHGNYPIPTIGEIKLQMYSNLAYGAQVLQYFTYWTPGANAEWDFHQGPIGLDGKRTSLYDRIKLVNGEIQNFANIFLNARVVSVFHTGKRIPIGTRRIEKLPKHIKALETSDGGAIVSLLEKENRQFLVIVNRDFLNPMKLTIVPDGAVMRVLDNGTLVRANSYSPKLEIDPGDITIFSWNKER